MKKKIMVVLVLALSVMMVGAAAIIVTGGQGQTAPKTNDRLAAAWPTVVYMTSNQTFFPSNQTPCAVPNNITGVVTFWPSQDNTTIFYTAWIGGNENITQVTLNLKQNGQVGQPAVYLYAPGVMVRTVTKVDQTDGLLAVGNFSATNFVGPLSGKTMTDLSQRIAEGNISVIASTSQCPMALRGEFGVFPFIVCPGQGTQASTTPTPSTQTPQGSEDHQGFGNDGHCQGDDCPMGQGQQGPYGPMGPSMDRR